MNNVCICLGKRANLPFIPKFSEFSLYSIEELCYYFMERSYVIDEDIVCRELVDWIGQELGLTELASELDFNLRKRVSASIFVFIILEYCGIYSQEAVKKTERIIREQSLLPFFERWKKRADYHYQMGKFSQAIQIYFYLLQDLPEEETQKKSILYYNIASIYAMDFAFEKACEYYEKSFELQPDTQTRVAFLLAKRMSMDDFHFGGYMREHPQWEQEFTRVNQSMYLVNQKWENSRTKEILTHVSEHTEDRKELIRNLKKDFRRQTM